MGPDSPFSVEDGADTRGGDGGPSLLRSAVVLDDQNGELMPVEEQ